MHKSISSLTIFVPYNKLSSTQTKGVGRLKFCKAIFTLKFTTPPLMKLLLQFVLRFGVAHWSVSYQIKISLKFLHIHE